MKKLTIGLLTLTAVLSVPSIKAQTADEIIANYETALGGKEKLLSLNSVKMNGSINVQGMDVGVIVTVLNGVGCRNDISVPGMGEGYQVTNSTRGWNFMPWQGQTSPDVVLPDQLKSLQGLLDLQGILVNYKEKGSQVELLGKENVAGTACYKLKVTSKLGKTTTVFIDAKTWYRVKSITSSTASKGEEDIEVSYSDYRKTGEGYFFPFSTTNAKGTIIFSSIEVNKPVDEKIFTVD